MLPLWQQTNPNARNIIFQELVKQAISTLHILTYVKSELAKCRNDLPKIKIYQPWACDFSGSVLSFILYIYLSSLGPHSADIHTEYAG
jgi:hypothetical protein